MRKGTFPNLNKPSLKMQDSKIKKLKKKKSVEISEIF